MAFFLAFKEVWRNKGRFFLFSLVIALITTLVLFVAALAEGLAQANRQYLEKLDSELLVFQANTELSTFSSRLNRSDFKWYQPDRWRSSRRPDWFCKRCSPPANWTRGYQCLNYWGRAQQTRLTACIDRTNRLQRSWQRGRDKFRNRHRSWPAGRG